jgi:hypothetical protein
MSVTLRSSCLALAFAAAGTLLAMPAVEAQEARGPLRVTVQKRSYLDPGPVVPVGSMNRYATAHSFSSPVPSIGERFSAGVLPSTIGAGTNPFANSWASPRW